MSRCYLQTAHEQIIEGNWTLHVAEHFESPFPESSSRAYLSRCPRLLLSSLIVPRRPLHYRPYA